MQRPLPAHRGVLPLLALSGDWLEAPPLFEEAVGYDGPRRYISFHLPAWASPLVEDGERVQEGHYSPFAVWSRHLSVWPAITGVGVGWIGPPGRSASEDPEHHVVLDRSTRRLYVGSAADVRRFLSAARATPFGTGAPAAAPPDPFGWEGVDRLFEWLDARPLPCPTCRAPHVASDFERGSADGSAGDDASGPHAGSDPACPTCGEPFYGRALLGLLAGLTPPDDAPFDDEQHGAEWHGYEWHGNEQPAPRSRKRPPSPPRP